MAIAGKVGIIYQRWLEKRIEIDVYIVDLDDPSDAGGGIIQPSAKFRAHRPEGNYPALCVLNSSLYLFEGFNGMKRRLVPPPPIKTRTAYKSPYPLWEYDLIKRQRQDLLKNSHLLYCLQLSQRRKALLKQEKEDFFKACQQEEEMEEEKECVEEEEEEEDRMDLTLIPPMNYPKGFPVALPTPDGKRILIFATHFAAEESGQAFELYSPSEGFVSLPRLPVPHHHSDEPGYICSICTKFTRDWPRENEDNYHEPEIEEVVSYCFIGASHFLIQMDFFIAYTIDLNNLGAGWTPRAYDLFPMQNQSLGFHKEYRGYFETFGDQYALMPATYPRMPRIYDQYKEDEVDAVDDEAALYVHYMGSDDGFFRKRLLLFDLIVEYPPKRFLLSSMDLPPNAIDPRDPWNFNWWVTGLSILPGRKNGRVCNYAVKHATGMEDANYVDVGMKDTYVVQHAERLKEGRAVIDVCRTDFNATPGDVTSVVSKSVSLTTLFSKPPNNVTCFTL